MKTPTLQEVKKHFENAETVKCLYNGKQYNISGNIKKNIHLFNEQYWIDLKSSNKAGLIDVLLWNNKKGYAKIISYKKPIRTNKLTELEKRVDVLENEIKKSAEVKVVTYKPLSIPKLNFGIDFCKPDSNNDILTPNAISLDKFFGVPSKIIKPGFASYESIDAFRKAFDSIDTNPENEVNRLKCRVSELEAENKHILAGGKSKWEFQIEELKALNHQLSGNVDFWQKECAGLRDFVEGIKNQSHNFLGMK